MRWTSTSDVRGRALTVLAVAGLSVPALATASTGWTPPQGLFAPSQLGVQTPRVAMSPDGTALLAWARTGVFDGIVQGALHDTQGAWGPLQDLPEAGDWTASVSGLALDRHDDAAISWGVAHMSGATDVVALRPAGGTWTARPYPPSGVPGIPWGGSPLAMDPDGKVVIAVRNDTDAGSGVEGFVLPPGASWVGPTTLRRTSTGAVESPDVAVDPLGRAVAVWSHYEQSGCVLESSSRPAGGAWSAPVTVGAASCDAWAGPRVGMSADGTATAVWRDGAVVAAQRPWASAAWSAAKPVSSSVADPSQIELATDAGGKAIAVWVSYGVVQAAVRPAAGAWQPPQNLSVVGAELPRVAIGGRGDAVVVWDRAIDANTSVVEATLRPTGGDWQLPPTVLSDPAHRSTGSDVALDPDGNALVAWSDYDGFNSTLAYSVHDVGAPVLSDLGVPATATVGQAVSVSVDASDRWTGVGAGPAWDFGDTTTAAGPTATHVYTEPGTYAVTVTAGDSAGNTARVSRQITVAPAATTPETEPTGTTGTVAGVTATLPGASPAATPRPSTLSRPALRKLPTLRVGIHGPALIRRGQRTVFRIVLSRSVHGALASVALRRGVSYRTVTRGRVSGRRVPVALSFQNPGRYLLRVQLREAGRPPVTKLVAVTVR